jgi:hypothetical protein
VDLGRKINNMKRIKLFLAIALLLGTWVANAAGTLRLVTTNADSGGVSAGANYGIGR